MTPTTSRQARGRRFFFGLCGIAAALALSIGPAATPTALAQSGKSDRKGGGAVEIAADGDTVNAAGANVVIRGTAKRIQAAGAVVDIDANVSGKVEAAGANVVVDGKIGGALRAAGALVEVRGEVDGDVYAGGAVVRFDAKAAKDVNLGGASIQIGSEATIAGDLMAGGASVEFGGQIDGASNIVADTVLFNGTTSKTVTLTADTVIVGSTANIQGDLVVRSDSQPVVEDGATISGQVVLEEPAKWWIVPTWLWWVVWAVAMAAGTILAGVILLVIGRGAFEEGLRNAAFKPLSSGLIGLATLIILPIVAVILMSTIIGVSFGFATLLVLPFLLIAGHAVVATCIGVWIFDRAGEPRSPGRIIMFLIAGAVIVAVVWLIPWAGPIVAFLAMLVGMGAYLRTLAVRMQRSRDAAPA